MKRRDKESKKEDLEEVPSKKVESKSVVKETVKKDPNKINIDKLSNKEIIDLHRRGLI